MRSALGVQIAGVMYVPVVLTHARARVCVKFASGELRVYASHSRRKIVNETDVTRSVTALMNYDSCVRLAVLATSPLFHARGKAHRDHVVYCVRIMATVRLVGRAPGLSGWV